MGTIVDFITLRRLDAIKARRAPLTADDVKRLREALGLTQSGLAEMVGVSVFAVSKWEQGLHAPSGAAKATMTRLLNDITEEQFDRQRRA